MPQRPVADESRPTQPWDQEHVEVRPVPREWAQRTIREIVEENRDVLEALKNL